MTKSNEIFFLIYFQQTYKILIKKLYCTQNKKKVLLKCNYFYYITKIYFINKLII